MDLNNAQSFTYKGTKPYIFISYSHDDSRRVLPVLEALNQRGYRVWYDGGIPLATDWSAEIADRLRHCGVCLAFHSQTSMKSEHCLNEIHYALKKNKPILSAYLEDIQLSDALDYRLSRYQSIKLLSSLQIDDFVTQLEQQDVFSPCREREKQDVLDESQTRDEQAPLDKSERHNQKSWLGIFPFLLFILFLVTLIVIRMIFIGTSEDNVPEPTRYSEWSEWSTSSPPSAPLGCTIEADVPKLVEDVPAYEEYRYGRWIGETSNWCKEYGEALHGGTYTVQETEWSTVRAVDTNTHWLCGHYDSEHPSHIHSSGVESRGYPMWTKYIVDGYDDPEFYWEETRSIPAVTHTEYRWRFGYYDYAVYFDANCGEGVFDEMTVTNGERYGQLPTPLRENYDFVGWFTKPKGGQNITDKSTVDLSSNQTLYAHWKYNPST